MATPHEWFVQLQGANQRYENLGLQPVPGENHPLVDYLLIAVGNCLKLAGESVRELRERINLSDKAVQVLEANLGDILPTANNLLHLVEASSQDHDRLIKALLVESQPFGQREE